MFCQSATESFCLLFLAPVYLSVQLLDLLSSEVSLSANLPPCLSVFCSWHLSTCLFNFLSSCLAMSLSLCQFAILSFCLMFLAPVYLSVQLLDFLSSEVSLSANLPPCLSVFCSLHLPTCLFNFLSSCLAMSLSLSLSVRHPASFFRCLSEAGISKNYCATNSGSPEDELRFCPFLLLLKYRTGWPYLNYALVRIMCISNYSERMRGSFLLTNRAFSHLGL